MAQGLTVATLSLLHRYTPMIKIIRRAPPIDPANIGTRLLFERLWFSVEEGPITGWRDGVEESVGAGAVLFGSGTADGDGVGEEEGASRILYVKGLSTGGPSAGTLIFCAILL